MIRTKQKAPVKRRGHSPELRKSLKAVAKSLSERPEELRGPFKIKSRGRVGRPPDGKVNVHIRLDPAVVAKFKATGPGWQARINQILMEIMK